MLDTIRNIDIVAVAMCSYYLHNVAGQGERHYLCILLGVVKAAIPFASLHTCDGVEHDNYKQAAIAHGLFEAHKQIMRDGAILQMPYELRATFAALLAFEDVIDPAAL